MAELKEILTQIKDEVYQEGYEKGVDETLDMLIDYFSYMKKKKRIVVDPEEDIKLLREVIRKGQR